MIVKNSAAHQAKLAQEKPDAPILKFLIVGEPRSGKTVLRYLLSSTKPLDKHNEFSQTIGVDIDTVDNSIVEKCFPLNTSFATTPLPIVRLFEVVGGSRFRTLLVNPTSKMYDGCIFVLTKKKDETFDQSLERTTYWLAEIQDCFRIKPTDDDDDNGEICDGKVALKNKTLLKPIYTCFIKDEDDEEDDEKDEKDNKMARAAVSKRIEAGQARVFKLFRETEIPKMRQMLGEIIRQACVVKGIEYPQQQNDGADQNNNQGFLSKFAKFFGF